MNRTHLETAISVLEQAPSSEQVTSAIAIIRGVIEDSKKSPIPAGLPGLLPLASEDTKNLTRMWDIEAVATNLFVHGQAGADLAFKWAEEWIAARDARRAEVIQKLSNPEAFAFMSAVGVTT